MMNLPISSVILTTMLCFCMFATVGPDLNSLQSLVLAGVAGGCIMLLISHGYSFYQKFLLMRRA
jgi:hypothetical protein